MKTTGVRVVFMGVLLDGAVAVTAVIVARAAPARLESADCMTGYVAGAGIRPSRWITVLSASVIRRGGRVTRPIRSH